MDIRIALAGNPNSGKTTLFNALTGSNQFVGNWPGVTVEKKEGKLKKHSDVTVTDLPGIYSLSPYTMEEVVARNYLIEERPDAILNIIDGTNLERNLYLTTQLTELGIPVVIAINMMDIVRKNGDKINIDELSQALGCKVVEISALKNEGIDNLVKVATSGELALPRVQTQFGPEVEHILDWLTDTYLTDVPGNQKRWYAIKLFERDENVQQKLKLDKAALKAIDSKITQLEDELDDDAESVITTARYDNIEVIISACAVRANKGKLSTSDKIDRVVTSRILGLPIFILVMIGIYYISISTIGTAATDWANDNLFGDGWYVGDFSGETFDAWQEDQGAYDEASGEVDAFESAAEAKGLDPDSDNFLAQAKAAGITGTYDSYDDETGENDKIDVTPAVYQDAQETMAQYGDDGPDPYSYGAYVPGVPTAIGDALSNFGIADWLYGLIVDGVVAGLCAMLGFLPQMFVLFILLALLEGCGYMSRVAFVLDRIFRRFGLSGKSFIPILIGTGCGVPGIMSSRTIEDVNDRRMTIMTTTFIPCGAKVPFIAMIAGALFGGSAIVSTSAYFIGMAAIIISGIMLKKTRMFAGDPAPFVMELPAYHWPTLGNVLRSMWERGWSFIKKAGTIILLSTIFVWFTTYFGWVDGTFRMLDESEIDSSILAAIGGAIAWIFAPLGWGNWQATVASITGLVAKENIVGTLGILYGGGDGSVYDAMAAAFTGITGYSFLVFNLLCAPCFAAIGAIKREMNNAKWTWFAIGYQCGFAYVIALMINQFGSLFTGSANVLGVIVAVILLAGLIYMLVRPYKEATKLSARV